MLVSMLCFVLFLVGLYGVIAKRNMVKVVLGLTMMEYANNVFWIVLGYRGSNSITPIKPMADHPSIARNVEFIRYAVDPVPQAVVLTSIVINLGVTAMLAAMCIRLYERHGTFDLTQMRRLSE